MTYAPAPVGGMTGRATKVAAGVAVFSLNPRAWAALLVGVLVAFTIVQSRRPTTAASADLALRAEALARQIYEFLGVVAMAGSHAAGWSTDPKRVAEFEARFGAEARVILLAEEVAADGGGSLWPVTDAEMLSVADQLIAAAELLRP